MEQPFRASQEMTDFSIRGGASSPGQGVMLVSAVRRSLGPELPGRLCGTARCGRQG